MIGRDHNETGAHTSAHDPEDQIESEHADIEPDEGLDDTELTQKDMSYSPSSGRETEAKQEDSADGTNADEIDPEIDDDAVTTRPGTGGPDDVGEVDADDEGIRSRIADRDASPGDRPVG